MKALGVLMIGAMAVAGGIAAATYITKKKIDKENEENYYDDWDNDNIDDDWDFDFDEDMEVEDEPAVPETEKAAPEAEKAAPVSAPESTAESSPAPAPGVEASSMPFGNDFFNTSTSSTDDDDMR